MNTSLHAAAPLAILGVPLLVSLALILFARHLRKVSGWLAGAAIALGLILTFALIPILRQGSEPVFSVNWMPLSGISLRLHVDWLTLPFLVTEVAVTLLAVIYAWGYHRVDERTPYFYALLLLFAAGMSGTTLADDLVLFYVFWELMLLASAALILFWGVESPGGPRRESVALKYVIFTHLGSLMVLVGLLVLYQGAGVDSMAVLRAGNWSIAPRLVVPVLTLFFLGFGVKMAIFPLHLWLPDAHTVAPMPVTIMLAAAMLSMGTYGILRFPFSLFSMEQLAVFGLPLMIAGLVSEVYGALIALVEKDLKRIIAYSSVSQMGYILFGLGTLTQAGITGATLHVIYHAIVKALLFMAVGLIIHVTGKRNLDEIRGLGRSMPLTTACAVVGGLAIAAVPPLCIFDSEWMIFAGGFETGHIALCALTLFGSLLTVAYVLRFAGRLFLGEPSEEVKLAPAPLAMLAPAVLLAGLSIIEGIFPGGVLDWVVRELPLLLKGAW
jgi:NADH-quinone oxidoreductase subunit M